MDTSIVLCVDDSGIEFINPLIRSIRSNVQNPIIYLITDSDKTTEFVDHRIHFKSPINGCIEGRLTGYMWTRCWIDKLIPNIGKCIYLDYDCIVTGDISDMLDCDEWSFRAVKYPSGPNFCSGVMAFNFNNPLTSQIMEQVRLAASPSNHDEEVLNVFCKKYLEWMPKEYMVMDLWSIIEKSVTPKVIHFCGNLKAWKHPLKYYFKYCNLEEDIVDLRN